VDEAKQANAAILTEATVALILAKGGVRVEQPVGQQRWAGQADWHGLRHAGARTSWLPSGPLGPRNVPDGRGE
jgi:hypothetical protein